MDAVRQVLAESLTGLNKSYLRHGKRVPSEIMFSRGGKGRGGACGADRILRR